MKVAVLGATGIIGQHMTLDVPDGVDAVFTCRHSQVAGFQFCDVTEFPELRKLLTRIRPEVIVNLAGESRPDVVEQNSEDYLPINTRVPRWLGLWTRDNGARLIQVSTQAVFSGRKPPYGPQSGRLPVNEYGMQKVEAEDAVLDLPQVTVIRPTFVLGVRPLPNVGRANPVELMLGGKQRKQVDDRWFSPSFAPDVATCIWNAALEPPIDKVIHAGVPVRVSRYQIACDLGLDVEPVSNDTFPGIAPRALDTTYSERTEYGMSYEVGLADCKLRWREQREMNAEFDDQRSARA